MQHKLSLEVPNILNNCIMRIVDTSIYTELIPVKCTQLLITIPGFSSSYFVENIFKDFSLNLTACDLSIQKINCGKDYNDLPDGVYAIKYSVSPNDIVYVEYNHLRITKALNKLQKIYCSLDLENCESTPEKKKKISDARLINDFLMAAKANVETCRQASKGLELYKEAMRMIDKINCLKC